MLFIIVTLSILTFSIVVGLVLSHIMLSTEWLKAHKISKTRYKHEVFKEHLPLTALNLSLLWIFTAISLYFVYPFFAIKLPSVWIFCVQFAIMIIAEDTYFYFYHRLLHESEFLFKKIHKIHHKASPPFALDFMYAHPLEWIGGLPGSAIGLIIIYFLFGEINAYPFWLFAMIRNWHEVDIHAGIQSFFTKYIPFWGTAEHHEAHHARIKGNYASTFTFWDKVFGTEIKK